jgi:hypothetical protein
MPETRPEDRAGVQRRGIRHQLLNGDAVNHSFILCCQKGKADGNVPAGFNLEEEMTEPHLHFLAVMVVIVIIKVKIIIKKR